MRKLANFLPEHPRLREFLAAADDTTEAGADAEEAEVGA